MKMEFIGCVLVLIIGVSSASNDLLDYEQHVKPCRPGEILENDCNKCICSKSEIFQCTPKKCNVIELSTSCRPDTVFEVNDKICICDSNGYWPHHECSLILQNLQDPFTCKPYSYFKVDCNVCRCTADGKLDANRCTKNPCNETQSPIKRRSTKSQVLGSCVEKTWYSLAPCQFCYCVNENKLVCNNANKDLKKLDLGTYNLNICGKDLPKEVFDLHPDTAGSLGNQVEDKENSSKMPTRNLTKSKKKRRKEKNQENNENNSNIVEVKPVSKESPVKKIARKRHSKKPTTVPPELSNSESAETKKDDLSESSNEIPVETEPKREKSEISTSFNLDDLKFSIPMKLNLPMVLDTVFKMAIRKSMITLKKDDVCEPGSTVKSKCNNVCICTNDKKMLCTKNAC